MTRVITKVLTMSIDTYFRILAMCHSNIHHTNDNKNQNCDTKPFQNLYTQTCAAIIIFFCIEQVLFSQHWAGHRPLTKLQFRRFSLGQQSAGQLSTFSCGSQTPLKQVSTEYPCSLSHSLSKQARNSQQRRRMVLYRVWQAFFLRVWPLQPPQEKDLDNFRE